MTAAEQWRPAVGWEGAYSVSDLGRVRSESRSIAMRNGRTRRLAEKILKPSQSPKNLRMILVLCDESGRTTVSVDKLVMEAFVGPRPAGLERLHWDDDPTNNALSNLRYGSRSDNLRDAVRNGRHVMANRTQCPQGHDYDEQNTYVNPRGGRECRTCRRDRQLDLRASEADDWINTYLQGATTA